MAVDVVSVDIHDDDLQVLELDDTANWTLKRVGAIADQMIDNRTVFCCANTLTARSASPGCLSGR
jgi:hypothetical protein